MAVALTLLLVLVNAFFVIAELALVRVRPTRLDELASRGNRAAARARLLVRHIDIYLSACQLGVTLASLALGWIGEPTFARLIAQALSWAGVHGTHWIRGVEAAVAFIALTSLHIVVGELAPKTVALRRTEELSLLVSGPMLAFLNATRPFIRLLNGVANAIVGALGLEPEDAGENSHSAAELRALVRSTVHAPDLDTRSRELLENAFDFSSHRVRQVMKPRGEVVFLSLGAPLSETMAKVRRSGFTRFPLCESDLDRVVGFVHVKDLVFPAQPITTPGDLLRICRNIVFIPENVNIAALLAEMRRQRALMALAVDEYGVVSGLCTMEDVLEQLVGEIQDEHDHEQALIRETPEGQFLVDGTMPVGDVSHHLILDLESSGCDTISGLVVTRLGRVPRVGDALMLENWRVRVVAVDGFRIARLAFTPITPT